MALDRAFTLEPIRHAAAAAAAAAGPVDAEVLPVRMPVRLLLPGRSLINK